MVIILMGVAGSGKSTIGEMVARALGAPFYDADDFHEPSAREKMKQGSALTDGDREPWLRRLADGIGKWNREGGITVLACSALKQKYRDQLSRSGPVQWVYLKGGKELIRQRLGQRKDHFMDPKLLDSQFDTLEEPKDAIVAEIASEPAKIVEGLLARLKES